MMTDAASAAFGVMASTAKAQLDSEIVTQTLDKLNEWDGKGGNYGGQAGMAQTYDFSKEVLSAVYGGKGAIASLTG